MSAPTEGRLMEMLEAALELPEAERADFLEARCGDDRELLRRAKALLAAAARPEADRLGARIGGAVGAAAASVVDEGSGYPDRIGPYTVTEVLGEGGMGVVLAGHQDEPVERDVAIKLIRAGAHAPRIVSRFHAERQALATLEHPNIAMLYDAGTTPDGLPYFVMELIRGEPLTDYCDGRGLGLDERLGLFRTLLGAVRHAHLKTLVHRDLKPSNVLVANIDGEPVLKVIDFGIARVASGEPGLTGPTAPGGGVGTLEYMSPEQILRSGHGADTRSDIYSLGVMLYQLVSGELPYDRERLWDASPTELERILLEEPVVPASRRAGAVSGGSKRGRVGSGRTRERALGDLDAIIEVAMARDPARRYETVARFDEDLESFLTGRPISARPSTWSYRARKFVRRNLHAVVGSALALLVVLGMAVIFTARLAEERDRAELEAEKARQIAGFLQSIFEVPDPATTTPADMTARELLDLGAERIENELADPDLRGPLFAVVGRTYAGLGLWERAETYLSRALEVERRTGGPRTRARADHLHALGEVYALVGRGEEAEAALREAVELRTSLLGRRHPETAAALATLSLGVRGQGRYDEAARLAAEAVSILRRSPDADSLALADALHALAFARRSQVALGEAEAHYREALEIRRRLLDPSHPDVLTTLGNLARVLEARGKRREAASLNREVLELRRERLGPEHPRTLNALNNLAFTLWRSGRYPEATDLFREAVQLAERIHDGDNSTLAITLNNLGVAQRRVGAYQESERSLREALAMDERLWGAEHPRVAGDMDNLGRTLLALGRAEEAESLHVAALAMRTEILGESHPDRAESLSALARARLRLGFHDDAVRLLDEALGLRSEALGPEHPRTAALVHELGVAHLESRALEDAERLLREALRVRRAALGGEHPAVAATLLELGRLLRETSRPAEARAALEEAHRISELHLDPSDPQRLRAERDLEALHTAGR